MPKTKVLFAASRFWFAHICSNRSLPHVLSVCEYRVLVVLGLRTIRRAVPVAAVAYKR